ncbi:MAG: alginate export family protein [Flavobacteriales bacterium]|nr:alginate export family protein [Flavobacteriales bacterium]
MRALIFIIIGLIFIKFSSAQETKMYRFDLLRQNDNIDSLKRVSKKNTYQKFKLIQLSKSTSMSFGGSWRMQYESFINEQFQNTRNQDQLWLLNRTMIHTHLKVKDKFEAFAELNNSLITDKDNLSPVDKDQLSVNQLFIKYHFLPNWSFGLGRENLKFGSGRLIDVREGPNVRRSFDASQLSFHSDKFLATIFFAIPVQPKPGIFDNNLLDFNETFSALYTTTNINKSNNIDLYAIYQKDNNVTYNSGNANERRTSLGARYFGDYKSLSYNNEIVYQFGDFGSQNIKAWTVSLQAKNRTKIHHHFFNIGLKTEIISGDKKANDNTLNTFDALYPRGAYFGRVARFGPSNLIDIHPYINTKFNKLFVEVDYDAFWRYSVNDGVYNAAMLLEYTDTNDQRFIAHQLGTIIGYQFNKFIGIELESNIIFPSAFLKEKNLNNTLYHFVFTTEIKF